MKRIKIKKIILIPLIVIFACVALLFPIKSAVDVSFVDGQYDIHDFVGRRVRLLCTYQQVTGSIWYARYIEVSPGSFAELEPGRDISLSSRGQPNISGEYTSEHYGKTQIILEGILKDLDSPEADMKITSWDIVYPIDTGWFTRSGYLKDHVVLLDLILK